MWLAEKHVSANCLNLFTVIVIFLSAIAKSHLVSFFDDLLCEAFVVSTSWLWQTDGIGVRLVYKCNASISTDN